MNIKIMKTIDEALIYVSSPKHRSLIETAMKIFKSPFGDLDTEIDREMGFNNWLIHDYLHQNKSIVSMLDIEDSLKNVLEKSIYSIFKVRLEHDSIIFKDVVTSVDYSIDSEQVFNSGDLVKIRIYPNETSWTVVDTPEYYDQGLEGLIRKSLLQKYNEYCSTNEPMHIEEFVKRHAQLIYHLTNIIDFYEAQLEDSEDFHVMVATYISKDKKQSLARLLESEDYQLAEVDGDETIIDMLSDGVQLAEIVVHPQKIEIEVVTLTALGMVKESFEEHMGELVVFLKEEQLSLEDLL